MGNRVGSLVSLTLVCLFLVTLGGCTTASSRPAPEAAPTAAPRSEPAEMATAAMDALTDPEPPGGRPDVSAIGDTVLFLESSEYDVIYSETKRNPLVVAYFLREHSDQDFIPCERPSSFGTDDRTATRVTDADYTNSGYDRGHMAPNAAIATRHGCDAQKETFVMTNVVPQLPRLNQRTWAAFEHVVDTVYADEFEGIWVLTGPVFDPTQITTIKDKDIEVPVEFWKIVIRRKDNNDLDAAGFIMKKNEGRNVPIGTFATTIDDIEARTNIDFFPDLPTAQEQALESACAGDDWHLDRALPAPHPGGPREINEDPPEPRSQSLGTQVGQQPVCAP